MSQITSPTRRVLGEKDKNASLNITSPLKGSRTPTASKTARSQGPPIGLFTPRPNLPPPASRAGQKRRINDVEGVEVQDWSKVAKASQNSEVLSDTGSESGRVDTSMSRSMADTNMTSFSVCQDGPNSLEPHFQLPQEEMSQQTLEKIHAVPMPQNPSQSLLAAMPTQPPGASQDSMVMSKYIDFGGSDASQRSDGLEMIEAKSAKEDDRATETDLEDMTEIQSERKPTEDEQRRAMLEEKAIQLRTRLRLAYFKVQTNQTMRPLSRLKVPESMKRTPSPPTLLSSSITAASAMAALEDMEARVSAFRAQATAQARPAVKSLNSLPVPSIRPTTYSARFSNEATIHGHPSSGDSTIELIQIPSSPPISRHSADTETDRDRHSQNAVDYEELPLPPTKSAIQRPANEQLSSPPASQSGHEDINDDHVLQKNYSQNTTVPRPAELHEGSASSVITSDAADGLLQLMRGPQ